MNSKIAILVLLSSVSWASAAQVNLNTLTDTTYVAPTNTIQHDDVRLTMEASAAKQQAMNSELYAAIVRSGVDFYSMASIDAMLTSDALVTKLLNKNLTVNSMSVPPNFYGAQFMTFGADQDLGTGLVGIGAQRDNSNNLIFQLPKTDPLEGQVMTWGNPVNETLSDNQLHRVSKGIWSTAGTGTGSSYLVSMLDWPASLTLTEFGYISNLRSDAQAQLDVLTVGSLVFDPVPTSRNSPHVSGISVSDDRLYVYKDGWKWTPLTDDLPNAGPVLLSVLISGSTSQTARYNFSENVTASTTDALCSNFNVSSSTSGALSQSYASGNNSTSVFCNITQPVYSGDTFDVASYTQGTVRSVATTELMQNISNFISLLDNQSTETAPSGATFTDTFSRADGEIGANYDIISNTPLVSASALTGGATTGIWYEASVKSSVFDFATNQEASIVFRSLTSNSKVQVIVNATGNNYYFGNYYDSIQRYAVCKVSGGSTGNCDLQYSGPTLVNGDVLTLKSVNGVVTLYRNGEQRAQLDDSAGPYTGGQPGLGIYRQSPGNAIIDDFEANDL
jgi:hypothetical protein